MISKFSIKEVGKEVGLVAYHTFKISNAFLPLALLFASSKNVTQGELSEVLDQIFETFYKHPLTKHSKLLTQYLRQNSLMPNEQTTENLIKFVVNQAVLRSPVAVPDIIINEFWTFFHELFSEPDIKGLVEFNLDIVRLVLRSYEPLIVDVINILKEARRINQTILLDLVSRTRVIRGDLTIIRRQIKALRYIKPFFMTDPRDFKTQAKIVAKMVREFGPFFIKMAQVAAANSDFLPEEISKELAVFQEDVPPMSAQEVMDAFYECVGKNPYECYFGFNPHNPLKSGSIGSVYLAKKPVMIKGKEVLIPVIIKVARCNLDREFLMGKTVIGLALLSTHYWAPHSKLAPFFESILKQVDEFVKGFQRELDFMQEAKIQQRFAERSKKSFVWHVPKIYFASRKVLEMEYIKGAANVKLAIERVPPKIRANFARQIASKFLYTLILHIFIYQEFHGDLHPGNVMISSDGKLYLIDWGNAVDMQGKWEPVWDYVRGAIMADVNLMAEALIKISTNPEGNIEKREQIKQSIEETLKKKNVTPLGKNFIFQLKAEGLEGLHRRFQAVMHIGSNAQQLGIIVKSEYMHLSRSLAALVGTYWQMYENVPKVVMVFDVFKTVFQFPLVLLKDYFDISPASILGQFLNIFTMPIFFKNVSPIMVEEIPVLEPIS
ncbi:MAG: phosphotransferase [Desulfobacterales bacterium]|nr:phosphotransferase [Desulfobacterales bacterium]MBF0396324.1 phosphotransferase [Desulfobacterales bacterium]